MRWVTKQRSARQNLLRIIVKNRSREMTATRLLMTWANINSRNFIKLPHLCYWTLRILFWKGMIQVILSLNFRLHQEWGNPSQIKTNRDAKKRKLNINNLTWLHVWRIVRIRLKLKKVWNSKNSSLFKFWSQLVGLVRSNNSLMVNLKTGYCALFDPFPFEI
jgi:hypothetical protein